MSVTNPVASGRPAAAPAVTAPSALYLLDLTMSPVPRRLLRWRALAQMRFRPGHTCVLVHDPSSGSVGLDWPRGTSVLQASALLDEAKVDAVNEWAYRTSLELVQGRGRDLFPTLSGVHFGDLLLTGIQDYLTEYGRLLLALRAAVAEQAPRTCRVFSADRSLARALAAELTPWVRDSRPTIVGRPEWLRRPRRSDRVNVPGAPTDAIRARVREGLASVEAPARRPRVLFVSESTPMAQMFAPIEQALRDAGVGPLLRLQYSTHAGKASDYRAAAVLAFDRPEIAAPSERGRYAAQWEAVAPRVREIETEWRLGWDGGQLPLEYLLEGQHLLGFDHFADHVHFAETVLDESRPELVVVGNDRWWVGQAFVRLARARGIPTACVQDGTVTLVPQWFWKTADRALANSTLWSELLVAHGTPAEECVVTGQARYDAFVRRLPPPPRAEAQGAFALPADQFWVLFATQPIQDAGYQQQVIEAVLAAPGTGVIVRPHPSQDVAALEARVRTYPVDRIAFQPKAPLFDLLCASDLVLVQYSTVAIEAAILGRPVITANFSGVPDPVPYARYGVSQAARMAADITRLVGEAAERWRRAETNRSAVSEAGMQRLVGPIDGRSTERTARVLAEMLDGVPA